MLPVLFLNSYYDPNSLEFFLGKILNNLIIKPHERLMLNNIPDQ